MRLLLWEIREEEWHSNFVSWLLDPKQNHKLGEFPLEKFLELVESKSENLVISKTDIVDMNFETEHKTNDGRSIDILGTSPSLVLVIENKIKARETFNKNGCHNQMIIISIVRMNTKTDKDIISF